MNTSESYHYIIVTYKSKSFNTFCLTWHIEDWSPTRQSKLSSVSLSVFSIHCEALRFSDTKVNRVLFNLCSMLARHGIRLTTVESWVWLRDIPDSCNNSRQIGQAAGRIWYQPRDSNALQLGRLGGK